MDKILMDLSERTMEEKHVKELVKLGDEINVKVTVKNKAGKLAVTFLDYADFTDPVQALVVLQNIQRSAFPEVHNAMIW